MHASKKGRRRDLIVELDYMVRQRHHLIHEVDSSRR